MEVTKARITHAAGRKIDGCALRRTGVLRLDCHADQAFRFAAARNHLINRAKRARIVSIELAADLEALSVSADAARPDRAFLRRLVQRCV